MIDPIPPGKEIFIEVPKGSDLDSSARTLELTGELHFPPEQLSNIEKRQGVKGLYNLYDFVQLLKAALKIK
jgi:hypothetical protein